MEFLILQYLLRLNTKRAHENIFIYFHNLIFFKIIKIVPVKKLG